MSEFVNNKTLNLGEVIKPDTYNVITDMWNYLTKVKKISPKVSAAILGNIWQECRFDDKRKSSIGASGFLQFVGDRQKDYEKWKLKNKFHNRFGQLDYILYALNHPQEHDLYQIGYNQSLQSIKATKKAVEEARGEANKKARRLEHMKALDYHQKVYGKREKNNELYFFEGLTNAMNDPNTSIEDLTTLWHNTIERSNPKEANIPSRINASNQIYNYFT